MDKIKSAYEMAMERFSQREAVPREEIDRLEYLEAGKMIAAAYLRESSYDLAAAIKEQPEARRGYLTEGVRETLLNNLQLPAEPQYAEQNQKVMSGLTAIAANKEALEAVFEQFKHLFNYYEQSVAQTYGQLKDMYRAKILDSARKSGNEQLTEQAIEPERYAGFRDEWGKARLRLNDQYQSILNEQKGKLRQII